MNLRLSYLVLATGLPLGALVAWQLGGSAGAGAMLGVLAALAISALGLAWQGRTLARGGRALLEGFVATFFAKLAVLFLGALALRFVDALGSHFDWSAYLLGFAATVVWAMLASSLGHLRSLGTLRATRIPRSTTP